MRLRPRFLLLSLFFLFASTSLEARGKGVKISSINIIDRNGLSQTFNSKDRLAEYEKTDFLAPQPYQKVMRVYKKEKNGNRRAQITSYHPNGQVKQYLEALNNRAFGNYYEWFSNGQVKVHATVIGGTADLNTAAEDSWIFDGLNRAWDEDGSCSAQIFYNKGSLENTSYFYHSNGSLWKEVPYSKNLIDGEMKIFYDDGTLFQSIEYKDGVKNGPALRYWNAHSLAYFETNVNGMLTDASYYDTQGNLISEIKGGSGFRAIFGKDELREFQEFKQGKQEGEVRIYDSNGDRISTYFLKNGEKEGKEIDYFPGTSQPKLLLTWHDGLLQGTTKTWYESGVLESQREMSDNKKNGLLTAWYQNGALMLVEEYDQDQLVKGEYYRMEEKIPVSKIEKGNGVATLFGAGGNFAKKIHYQEGRPLE
ncbi:MAG: hypothetical protein S4CHLAM45_10860 [Chlamydiales bacterium]|nr:hypothetical protein [Chlamydiales bacterium]MCH9619578.1 hypothetical protein [Chlamydiales bacterium]MCH9623184.1 hypothetical protein [Chlamydiales bacterium]